MLMFVDLNQQLSLPQICRAMRCCINSLCLMFKHRISIIILDFQIKQTKDKQYFIETWTILYES